MDPIDLTSLDIALQSSDGKKEEPVIAKINESSSSTSSDEVDATDTSSDDSAGNAVDTQGGNVDARLTVGDEGLGSSSNGDSPRNDKGTPQIADGAASLNPDEGNSETAESSEQKDEATARHDVSSQERDRSSGAADQSTQNPQSSEADAASAESSKATNDQKTNNDDASTSQDNNATKNRLNIKQETTTSQENTTESSTTPSTEDDEDPPPQILVDYASKVSGGQILEKSPSLKGTSNLLTGDIDRYAIAPCQDKKYVVIGLSEDILVKIIQLSNYEKYSSHVKEFQVLASQEYPTQHPDQWTDLGTYTALSKSGEQTFELVEPAWARYLKFKFLSHYGVEHYCTVSQIKVHGSTMLQGFHEQWIESEKLKDEGGGDGDGVEEEIDENDVGEGEIEHGQLVKSETDDMGQVGADYVRAEDDIIGEAQHDDDLDAGVLDGYSEQQPDIQPPDTIGEGVDETENTGREAVSEAAVDEAAASSSSVGSDSHREEINIEQKAGSTNAVQNDTSGNEVTDEADVAFKEQRISKTDVGGTTDQAGTEQIVDMKNKDVPSSQNTLGNSQATAEKSDDSKEDTLPPKEISESTNEALSDDESNILSYGVADVVKAAVAHVTDELLHVKEAVESTDTVTEIKKIIRTTVAVTDEGGSTELDAVGDVRNNIVEESGSAAEYVDAAEPNDKADQSIESIATDKNISVVNVTESELSNMTELESKDANITDNAVTPSQTTAANTTTKSAIDEVITQQNATINGIDNRTEIANPPQKNKTKGTNKTASVNSPKKNRTTSESTKTQSNASTLKIDPTATLPRKRNSINKSTDHIKQLMSTYPSASCIKDLDFHAFKAKTMVANPTLGGAIGAGGAKMEPIFQKITSEIKSVQTTQHQYEQYISAIKNCYEKVLAEMASDMDTQQRKFDSRLTVLEMMLLERSEIRRSKAPTFYGSSLPSSFLMTSLMALLPVSVNVQCLDEVLIYRVIAVLFISVWLIRRRKKKDRSTHEQNTRVTYSSAESQATAKGRSPGDPSLHSESEEGMIYPRPVHNPSLRPINIPSEVSHAISNEEDSVDSVPSLPRSEPTVPTSHSPMNESCRRRFFIRKRAKSDGMSGTL